MNTQSLMVRLGKLFPQRYAEPYDHPGLQMNRLKKETGKILLSLDFDDQVYPVAEKERPDLIITHHPFIFGTLHAVLDSDPVKEALYRKMQALGIPIVSYHTNFDFAPGGMNDAVAEALDLSDVKPLVGAPGARGGKLKKPMEVHEFAKYAMERLNVGYGLLIAEGKKTVSSVAFIAGGGWRENSIAQDEGYDIYISGDIPHHARREIVLRHYDYLDLPHEIERIFMPQMKKTLLRIDPSLTIITVDHEKLPEVVQRDSR
jgi:dinuclear metal center YbgI/SA1388 family protein